MKYTSFLLGVGLLTFPVILLQRQSPAFSITPANSVSTLSKPIVCAAAKGLDQIVCLAEAFKATLSKEQSAELQLPYSKADAVKWSNFPQAFSRPKRVGLSFESLNATQLKAAKTLLGAVMTNGKNNEGLDEMEGILVADEYLKANGGGPMYGAGLYNLAFLGTPSTSGLWELQFGGHHYAFATTYKDGKTVGVTPAFLGVEPMATITVNNRTYQPVEQERQALATMLSSLSSNEQTTAKLSSTFRDILLGPGKDDQFPTTKQGLKVGSLSAAKKNLVLNAINSYVNDLDSKTAAAILTKYKAELEDTYLAYSGTLTMSEKDDYVRIDGPSVWIEYSSQGGIVVRGVPHPHSVWRDRRSDYGGQ